MELKSRLAKNYYKIIKFGNPFNADKMLSDIKAGYDRDLMSLDEKVYLEGLITERLLADSEQQVKYLNI